MRVYPRRDLEGLDERRGDSQDHQLDNGEADIEYRILRL